MKSLDLRLVGKIFGMDLYVDISTVPLDKMVRLQKEHLVQTALIRLITKPNREWWVTDMSVPGLQEKIAGPFTTQDDAAVCRQQIEKINNGRTYWLSKISEPKT